MTGLELDTIRKSKNLSYEKLAAILGCHRHTVFRWCKQHAPIPPLTSLGLDSLLNK